ncbi:uncharacterized protein LOC133405183 [Phycodurus eques]|uniref:uncharacterized protein LOC133405183 n=1 Tax=Phycodurus eques TaxID=693459 RepID=UPI002ACDCD30|nr:uncharacterized protein LOC133405183 [Phycodurus eques]
MEDFEFSVEICDRDWQYFFEVCEECDLRPPSLATAEDSGLSDGDRTNATLAENVRRTGCYREADFSLDNTPDFKGSDVETHLGKKATAGTESILSGSEEDIRLQSVSMFSEGMANQANVGKNKESQREGGLRGNGIKSSSEPPAIDVQENNLDKMNTMQKAQPVSNTVLDPTACSSQLKNDRSAHTESFIGVCAETRTNETTLHKPDDSLDLYRSRCGTASTKEVLGLPSSLLTAMKRRRRKKRWLSMASTQSGHERRADEEQSQAPFCHDIKLLPGGGPFVKINSIEKTVDQKSKQLLRDHTGTMMMTMMIMWMVATVTLYLLLSPSRLHKLCILAQTNVDLSQHTAPEVRNRCLSSG